MNSIDSTFKKLQQEVVEGNQQLDLIFNSLPQSLALVTPDFEILRVNKLFLSLYGVKNEDVIGKRCHEACFGLETVCEGCLVKKALASKKPEKKIKSFPTGEICEMTAQPVFNELGEITHVLDMRTNITELVEKERELQRIQFAMNQSTDEFWLFDKDWKVVYASSSASNNLGYGLHELKGAHIEKFNILHRIENLPTLFERLRKKKNLRIESIQYKNDGSTYPCEMNLSHFADTDEFIYAVVRNISKRKKYENELIESRENAERASKLKSVFLANMSHEIRTPMNAIIGFSNFVLEEDLDEATKQELKSEIKSNSDYLLSIISDIMEISQIESGNRKAQFSEFNLSLLLENIKQEQSRKCPPSIELKLQLDIPTNTMLNSDKNLIKQIFDRLIGNAIKFTGTGEVEMGCVINEEKKTYDFYVKDNGIGISAQQMDEIFEPFHQLNSMMKGVGIGLTICREHAALLKSKIQVQSELGKGATFSFKIK
ncbi:MAG: PAS domain-containing sensor histidine kinase [Prolixibacteraceae bacterium]